MATFDFEVKEVVNFFKNKGITISGNNFWLRSCIDCFRTQCTNYRIKDLFDFVLEQWLLADLKEVNSNTLPKECSTLDKYTLLGKHAVQINYVLDVSCPAYVQLQKTKRPESRGNLDIASNGDNEEQFHFHKNTVKRSLKLEITDGQLTVTGFEDKPIPSLKNPFPGEKAVLIGPIECRKGILMLTEKNIEILGGEVDTLLVPNAVVNVLARILDQPLDPNPYKQHLESLSNDQECLSNCLDEDDDALVLLAQSMEMPETTQSLQSNSDAKARLNSNDPNYNDSFELEDDDFDLVAAQTASLAEMEAYKKRNQENLREEIANTQISRRALDSNPQEVTSSALNNIFEVEYMDMNNPKRLKKELEESYGKNYSFQTGTNINKANNNNSSSNVVGNKPSYSQATTLPPSNNTPSCNSLSSSSSIKAESELWEKEATIRSENKVNNSEEFPTEDVIEEIIESDLSEPETFPDENSEEFHQPYPPRKFPALRVVRGQVIRLSEKLTLKKDQWSLSAIVLVKGIELEMNFASEVLDKIFGVTAAELISRRNDLKTNPAAKENMNKSLRESQLRIKNLNCEMVIRFSSVIAKPVIIDVMQ